MAAKTSATVKSNTKPTVKGAKPKVVAKPVIAKVKVAGPKAKVAKVAKATTVAPVPASEHEPIVETPAPAAPEPEPVAAPEPEPVAATPELELAPSAPEQAAPVAADATPEPTPAKSAAAPKGKRVSALDAAARLLQEVGEPMDCRTMVEQMTAKGYWASPGGKTPAATLYSAIIREIAVKGPAGRFAKTERGKFVANAAS